MSVRRYDIERQVLCGHAVYPGHPVVLALLITHIYPSFDDAARPTGQGWSHAVGNGDVPGGGGEVGTAVELLRRMRDGLPVEEAIAIGNQVWASSRAGGHEDRVQPGQEQADRIALAFRERVADWLALSTTSY